MSVSTHNLSDPAFVDHVADALASLPGIEGVALGGSRGASELHPAGRTRRQYDPAGSAATVGIPGGSSKVGTRDLVASRRSHPVLREGGARAPRASCPVRRA